MSCDDSTLRRGADRALASSRFAGRGRAGILGALLGRHRSGRSFPVQTTAGEAMTVAASLLVPLLFLLPRCAAQEPSPAQEPSTSQEPPIAQKPAPAPAARGVPSPDSENENGERDPAAPLPLVAIATHARAEELAQA